MSAQGRETALVGYLRFGGRCPPFSSFVPLRRYIMKFLRSRKSKQATNSLMMMKNTGLPPNQSNILLHLNTIDLAHFGL